jgi:quercetin dioxygenase-like cupin family protein
MTRNRRRPDICGNIPCTRNGIRGTRSRMTGPDMTKTRPQATSKRLLETDRTIVTEWRFAPGAETGWHRHAHDYVVVVITAGKLMQETENGEIVTELALGQAYARNVGVEHNVVNPNPHEFAFIEVELK